MTSSNALFDTGAMANKPETARRIRRLFESMHGGWSDEDLLQRPTEAEHFCRVVRHQLAEDIEDYVILGFLMNPRKKGGHRFGKVRGRVRLEVELAAAGIDLDRAAFCDMLADLFNCLYRNHTVEDMLRRSGEGKEFCRIVRRRLDTPDLPEPMICGTLINLRKSGTLRRKVQAVA